MDGNIFQPHEVIKKAKALSVELFFSLSPVCNQASKTDTFIGWLPPPLGFMKLNIDGSAFGDLRKASAGGLLRDCNG
jgi:hypothetical protein